MTPAEQDAFLKAKDEELEQRRRRLGIKPPEFRDQAPIPVHGGSFVRLGDVMPAVIAEIGMLARRAGERREERERVAVQVAREV